ncbi:hypothetical protein BZK31_04635 [Pseudomonas floridensis]|uniref:Uncharacterized protein n=1 Tax=Pseudomonas floridensis TaxID=1958950 RepID=A0A1X0NAB8_9PSED|nr:hypothetical protein [Pseudomonas floridensis]ORC61040.1 hypothetical protein BZK31_04635 [Pseudomonas floridensis]
MQTPAHTGVIATPMLLNDIWQFGGDQSPLNDADADEDTDPEAYLDLDILGLDDFVDADKLDPTVTGDIGSSTLG